MPHNTPAEPTLACTDALRSKAPNADISFLEATVWCQVHHTLDLVAAGKDQRKKEALIDFCIKQGRKVREERNKKKKQITQVMLGSQRGKW